MEVPVNSPRWINPNNPDCIFPDVSLALDEPNGLLAVGGNLSQHCLLNAYRNGIFPWYSDEQPILWWSPDPRAVLIPSQLKISRSLRKSLKNNMYSVTMDTAFEEVVKSCAEPRTDGAGTWITSEMMDAYIQLHTSGYAHSVETWHQGQLVGGIYGVALGRLFFGESMFYRCKDASKIAFVYLVKQLRAWDYKLIDCQIESEHLQSLGAETMPREEFVKLLEDWRDVTGHSLPWQFDPDIAIV